jgi:hypothetical protein
MNLSLPATVLILSANPKGTTTLRLDEEQREIKASLKRSRLRDHFDPITETAVRTGDLRLAMLEHQPQIVHFSGHGEGEAGLVFEDETGRARAVSGEALGKSIKFSLMFCGALGLMFCGIIGLIGQPSLIGFGIMLAWCLIFGIVNGLTFGLVDGLKADIETRRLPNQGIWNSAKNTIILTLLSYPTGVFLDRCLVILFHYDLSWLSSLVRGLAWALIFGIGTSGKACVQHGVLRLLLYLDRSIPWNYAQFLQSCTERSLLQQVGGRFRFVHKQLQEHFAEMPFRL